MPHNWEKACQRQAFHRIKTQFITRKYLFVKKDFAGI
jgi:hypothetical protein